MKNLSKHLLPLVVLALAACGDNVTGARTGTGATGTYTLRTFNGQPPPVTVQLQPGFRQEILADQYTLFVNGGFSRSTDLRETIANATSTRTRTYIGSWALNGNTVTFNSTEAGLETATFSGGNTLTFVTAGGTAVYRR